MSIVSILRDAVPVGSYFSYGTTFDQNIVIETDSWMYLLEFPVRGNVDYEGGYTTYECIILVGKFSKFELEVADHMAVIEKAEEFLYQYLNTIWESANVLNNVRMSHFKNRYDANLSGARASFIMQIPLGLCLPIQEN